MRIKAIMWITPAVLLAGEHPKLMSWWHPALHYLSGVAAALDPMKHGMKARITALKNWDMLRAMLFTKMLAPQLECKKIHFSMATVSGYITHIVIQRSGLWRCHWWGCGYVPIRCGRGI